MKLLLSMIAFLLPLSIADMSINTAQAQCKASDSAKALNKKSRDMRSDIRDALADKNEAARAGRSTAAAKAAAKKHHALLRAEKNCNGLYEKKIR